MNCSTKIKIVLITAIAVHLFLIGYLLWTKSMQLSEIEWQVKMLMFDFTFSHYNVFIATLLSLGIFVLVPAIHESGFLH